jgi:hypothetical protein
MMTGRGDLGFTSAFIDMNEDGSGFGKVTDSSPKRKGRMSAIKIQNYQFRGGPGRGIL